MKWLASLSACLVLLSLWGPAAAVSADVGRADVPPARSAGATQAIDAGSLEAFLNEFFAKELAERHIPGVVITFVQDGEILLSKGYGYANLEQQVPMSPEETVMRIGSVSKLFVATAAMQLVEQGKLDLQADIRQYLAGFPLHTAYPQSITLAQLLTHSGGFGDRFKTTTDPTQVPPLGAYLAQHMPPQFERPGEIMSYSNHGYALAAYVVERVAGIPFDQYVKQNILLPLGMTRSSYVLSPPLPAGLATGYLFTDNRYTPKPMDYDGDYPGGSLVSTAADMARFMLAHLDEGCYQDACILQPATLAEMQRRQFANHPQLKGQAYGFVEGFENGRRVLGHSGATSGFGSIMDLVPEHGVGYFMSFNEECLGTDACGMISTLRSQLFDRYFPAPATTPSSPVPSAAVDRLAGHYQETRYERNTINKIGWFGYNLVVTARGRNLLVYDREYMPIEPLVFQEVGGERRIAFREDARGRIRYMFQDWVTYERLAWYETGSVQKAIFKGFGWFWGLPAGIWPATLLLRRWRRLPPTAPLTRVGGWMLALAGILNVIFLNSLVQVFWSSHAAQVALLVLPLVSAAATAVALVAAGLMWWRKSGSLAGRLYCSLVAVIGVAFLCFLNSWNLLGFRFG